MCQQVFTGNRTGQIANIHLGHQLLVHPSGSDCPNRATCGLEWTVIRRRAPQLYSPPGPKYIWRLSRLSTVLEISYPGQDGGYLYGGGRYRLRMQRSDVPFTPTREEARDSLFGTTPALILEGIMPSKLYVGNL